MFEPVAVHGHHAQPRGLGEEPREILEPGEASRRRARQRNPGFGLMKAQELVAEREQVVAAWTPANALAGGQPVPREDGVELRLVSELDRLDVGPAEARQQCARLGLLDDRAVGLEVDPDDVASTGVLRQRSRDTDPLRGDRVRHAGWLLDMRNGPPTPVGGVPADSQNGSLTGGQVLDQTHEHGVDRGRIRTGIGQDAPVLERETDETRRERPRLHLGRDLEQERGKRRGRCGSGDDRARRVRWFGSSRARRDRERAGHARDAARRSHQAGRRA